MSRLKEPTRSQTTPTSLVNMATLMRCMRGVCTILLEPALAVRISNRYVRTVRNRPPAILSSSSSEKEDSVNLNSGENKQVKGVEGLEHACSPSAQESLVEGNQRNACQNHGDTMIKLSESHAEKARSKRTSPALSSKPPGFHQMESLRYEKAQPDDKRVS